MSMFNELTNLTYKRTPLQAVGFYLVYLIALTIAFYLINYLLQFILPNKTVFQVALLEQIAASLTVTFLVLTAKNMMGLSTGEKRYANILFFTLLLAAGGVLAGLGGLAFGLLPGAYLTTYPKLSKSKSFWT